MMRSLLCILVLLLGLTSARVNACSACFGQSDSPLAQGMNMGILSLLVVVVFVLGGVAAFFVYLAKKSAQSAASTVANTSLQQSGPPAAE